MKITTRLVIVGLVATALAPIALHAEEVATTPAIAADVVSTFITTFATSHPWITTALAVIGSLRVVFKPLMGVVEAYVKSSASTTDDAWLAKIEASTAYTWLAYVLDFVGSIKVGTVAKAVSGSSSNTTTSAN